MRPAQTKDRLWANALGLESGPGA